ncbi:L-threonine 3-dehydrogenase-like [Liolophura sinensis]|uniref:L-threonine 3-dehydrogenase-like n=1 Tax=Liolophura sinensis TaxID=3198878 RepID=UPI00315808CD
MAVGPKSVKCIGLVFHGMLNDHKPSFTLKPFNTPPTEHGEILLKIRLCSICGSDLHTMTGMRSEPCPSILGHEAVGEVLIATGREEDSLRPGDRVTFSVADSCQSCSRCRDGIPQKCIHLFKYGHTLLTDGTGLNGCYATHIVLRKGTAVVKIPADLADSEAVSANCALATMVNAVSHVTETQAGARTVVIQGSGLLGLYGCALFAEKGYGHVYCTDIDNTRLECVSKFDGIPWNTLTGDCPTSLPEEDSVDVVVEVCGDPKVIQHGVRLLRPGGTYILVGMVTPNSHLGITGEQIIRKCMVIRGIHNYSPRHLTEAVQFLARTSHRYPYTSLVSQPISLMEYEKAFSLAKTRRYQRVIMQPNMNS